MEEQDLIFDSREDDYEVADTATVYKALQENINGTVIGPFLGGNEKKVYSTNTALNGCLTLRECNMLYVKSRGCKSKPSTFPEFDRCTTKGSISPLRKFNNALGHFIRDLSGSNSSEASILCFKPELYNDLSSFVKSVSLCLKPSIARKYLWNIENCELCFKSTNNTWVFNSATLDSNVSSILDIFSTSFPEPLSVHSQYAWYETQDKKDAIYRLKIFNQPEETTAVTGTFGTLQNNQLVDLAQEKEGERINVENRYRDLNISGFLCSGHTAHTMEAGRVRRLCHGVSVRIINEYLVEMLYKVLQAANKYNCNSKQWLLFCMGKITYCSSKALIFIRDKFVSLSRININMPTIHINTENHTAIISISSGVVLRRDVNNLVIDSTSVIFNKWFDNKHIPQFPDISTNEGFKFYFSGYFQLTPYLAFDRPPRTLISSVQSIQAVTTPYGAGTSSVAPNHTSKPLVSTELVEQLLNDTVNGSSYEPADLVPGEDLVVCFANFNKTNEDSIMISEGSIGRGLFSHMAYSAHVIKDSELIPEIGDYTTIYENKWWKSYSRRQETIKLKNNPKHFIAGGDGRGKVISKTITQTGQISVKVLRYSTPVTGDKIATGHGQKGVIHLIPQEDMPWGIDDNGQPILFDIVVSLSSITNRLTNGQYYEMVSGVKAAKEGKRLIIAPSQSNDEHLETLLYNGTTGNLIERCSSNGDVPIKASWGINRVWQMTQLVWDKQHYTHNTAGSGSIIPTTGRTAGGGIRFGEMEGHAIDASGLVEPYREIKSRMDLIDVEYCNNCETLLQMCTCKDSSSYTKVSIPHSMIVFSYANLLTTGSITKFKITF